MVFSSITFLFYFLPIFFLLYHITPTHFKNGMLVFASLIFYAWGEPVYVLLMLFSTVTDYAYGLLIEFYQKKTKGNLSLFFLVCSLITNLTMLIIFKYTDFLIESFNILTGLHLPLLGLSLPIGISFYTFQTMSYSIDVYRKKVAAQHNIIDFAAYVTLFPQLIAGPIVRYTTVEKELKSRTPYMNCGIEIFILGLSQKVLLANNIGLLWEEISTLHFASLPTLTAWLGIIAYGLQIYFDFCGYSNMAIGLGKMLGFNFPKNFDYPYISKSITEFWHRWHISLSTWFKEYVYIPLGGNRHGVLLQIRNIFIVWLLTGIWHGASWNFLFWGLYFAILLIIEKLWLGKLLVRLPSFLGHLYALFCIFIGWVLFAFDNTKDLLWYLSSLFGKNPESVLSYSGSSFLYFIANNFILLLCCFIFSTPLPKRIGEKIKIRYPKACILKPVVLTILFIISLAYIVDSSYNPFLYFRF